MYRRLPLFRWSSVDSLRKARQAHGAMVVLGELHLHHQNLLLARLVDLRCPIDYCAAVFRRFPFPDGFSYGCMIRALAMAGHPGEAVSLYTEQLLCGYARPSHFAYPFLLKASSVLAMAELGRQLHSHVLKLGFLFDVFVGNSLIDMYCKCSVADDAQRMFDEMPERDGVSWNSIIAGYASCGMTSRALQLFEEMPVRRNVICWTAVINGLGRDGRISDMLAFFCRMLISGDGACPNAATMVSLLAACSAARSWPAGRWVSVFIDLNEVPQNAMVSTALVDMLCCCGALTAARRQFDKAPEKNPATWNAMMGGYIRGGQPESAVQLFSCLRESSSSVPNQITLVNLFCAYACMGALEQGKQTHVGLCRDGADVNVFVSTALVNMYAKCGEINLACLVFVKTAHKDLGMWNAILTGLAAHGRAAETLIVFSHMCSANFKPNEVTFIGILSACSHAGYVDEGRENFIKMAKVYRLKPHLEHYTCMVDLLGRAGHIEEALALVVGMEIEPDYVIWGSLLNSCMIHREIKLAEKITKEMSWTKEKPNLGCNMLVSNIYASKGLWEDVSRVRRLMKESGTKKVYGCSWVEVDGIIHRFLVEDTTHEASPELYEMITRMMDVVALEEAGQINLETLHGSS